MKREIFYRLLEIEEYIEDITCVKAGIELYPRYEGDDFLINTDKKLQEDLETIYTDNEEYIKQITGKAIRDLAVTAWEEEGKNNRAEKLKELKMKVIDIEKEYQEEYGIYSISIIFKPFIAPVFGNGFYYYGIVHDENLTETIKDGETQ